MRAFPYLPWRIEGLPPACLPLVPDLQLPWLVTTVPVLVPHTLPDTGPTIPYVPTVLETPCHWALHLACHPCLPAPFLPMPPHPYPPTTYLPPQNLYLPGCCSAAEGSPFETQPTCVASHSGFGC